LQGWAMDKAGVSFYPIAGRSERIGGHPLSSADPYLCS